MYNLNMMGFSKYINLEFVNDITVGNLFIKEKIGILDKNKAVKRNNRYYTKAFERPKEKYILYTIKKMWKVILEEEVSLEKVKPDLRYLFNIEENGIIVQVGASSRVKVCSPLIMAKYLNDIEKISNEKITLVGHGKDQEEYAKKLEELLPNIEFNNLVGKTTIKGVFEEVARCRIYIGFDSGLYNLAFTLKKKIIALFRSGEQSGFLHKDKTIKILYPTIEDANNKLITDEKYSNKEINSISVEKVVKAYKKLMDIKN